MKYKILLIEPDRSYRKLIIGLLNKKYEFEFSENISDGYSAVSALKPDIIIIDPIFPKKEGIEFIRSIREWSDCPIIAISSNGTENAAVTAIEAGADDYIRKPFFSAEFISRIAVAAKRIMKLDAARGIANISSYKNNDLLVEFENNSVYLKNQRLHLTKNEFKILSLLCRNSGKVLTYDFIIKNVWGPRSNNDTGILRVNLRNLRKKLETDSLCPKYLFTENGIGYRMAENQLSEFK